MRVSSSVKACGNSAAGNCPQYIMSISYRQQRKLLLNKHRTGISPGFAPYSNSLRNDDAAGCYFPLLDYQPGPPPGFLMSKNQKAAGTSRPQARYENYGRLFFFSACLKKVLPVSFPALSTSYQNIFHPSHFKTASQLTQLVLSLFPVFPADPPGFRQIVIHIFN